MAGGPAVAVIDRWAEIVVGALKKERGRCLWVHPQTKREMVVSTGMDGGEADVIVPDQEEMGQGQTGHLL